jgi:aryl-alcohol dehydrogenase-like predicted oxidoreductase
MQYRLFKGLKISEVGLGTWQLGNADWGQVKGNEALEILQAFSEAGGNFIDTSDVYGLGVSERTIGNFLKSSGKKFLLPPSSAAGTMDNMVGLKILHMR